VKTSHAATARADDRKIAVEATPPQPDASMVAPPPGILAPIRPKKKGGLQLMLDRNRERQSREKSSANSVAGGLAMFLSNL
jgi:hypothetical protein